MKLKRQVVMLPTNGKAVEKGDLVLNYPHSMFIASDNMRPNTAISDYYKSQHLYITSDEKPVDGDWIIPNNPEYGNRIWKYTPAPCPMPYWGCADNCKKIIASTDRSLGVSRVSDGFIKKFIERYNAGTPITEVMVEYVDNGEEDWHGDDTNGEPFWNEKWELKVDKNNCITITAVKDTWTREEVISLCRDCFENSCKYSTFNEWIEQNL